MLVRSEEMDFCAGGRRLLPSFSSEESFLSVLLLLPQSKAVPGVFGVLLALPKLAKAPLPSPNDADPLALVGEATEVEDIELKGLFLVLMLPKRLAEGVESWASLRSEDLFIERESVLLLWVHAISMGSYVRRFSVLDTLRSTIPEVRRAVVILLVHLRCSMSTLRAGIDVRRSERRGQMAAVFAEVRIAG